MSREPVVPAVETGGGGEYVIHITEAYFAPSPLYTEKAGRPTLFLHWLGTTDREAQPAMDRDSYHPSFNCGTKFNADWESLDGGRTAVHPSGQADFGKQSRMFKLLKKVEELVPETDDPATDPLDNAGPGRHDASIWVGHTFRMGRVQEQVEVPDPADPRSKIKRDVEYDFPIEYLGKGVIPTVGAPVVAAASAPVAGGASTNPAVLRARLVGLAKSSVSHESFSAAAVDIPGVVENDDLMEEIFDEVNGIYATVRG